MKVDGILFRQILQIRSEGEHDFKMEKSNSGGSSKEVSLDPLSVPIMLSGDSKDEVETGDGRLEGPVTGKSKRKESKSGGGMNDFSDFEDVDTLTLSSSSEGESGKDLTALGRCNLP